MTVHEDCNIYMFHIVVVFNDDSLINQLVHQENGMFSNNIITELNFHGISAGSLYSPTVLPTYLIYKQILPWRCAIRGPNNTQGVSFIISLRLAALAHRHKMSPAMLRAKIKEMLYTYSFCDLHSHNTMLYFCQWITGGSTILRNTGKHLTRNNTVSWPQNIMVRNYPRSAIRGKTPETWEEMVHI